MKLKVSWRVRVMNNSIVPMILLLGCALTLASCGPAKDYQAYRDQTGQGEQVFDRHFELCYQMAYQKPKPIEGSSGAGQRLIWKGEEFHRCMLDHNWVLK
ncbi:hypothetical protein ACTRW9_00565 [Nitrospina sp. 32_T5]|uniref:hypothetical protein n=1 Tax=unclassified Nitrospina TaxID=2638683 RepID=UPI003F9CE6DB